MKKKKVFYTELSYVLGLIILAFGAALMVKADYGVSMVVAPAYILHLKISQYIPFFSFGMAEYTLQAVIILCLVIILRKFKISYLYSFVTALLYGFILDFGMLLTDLLPFEGYVFRTICFLIGMQFCAIGVSLFFHTYISPEAYELVVKELSQKFNININKFKTGYDCVSCVVAICLSFAFFGLWQFEGVKFGTIICAFANGTIIGLYSRFFERHFEFKDRFPLRKYF